MAVSNYNKQSYINGNADKCLCCWAENSLSYGDPYSEGPGLAVNVSCDLCKASWTEEHTLTDLTEIEEGIPTQGWDIFVEEGKYKIEKEDESNIFESDEKAIEFVKAMAEEGYPKAIKALEMQGREVEK